LNLGHLYFDIVSDLGLRISDFASPGIFTLVKDSLQISSFMQNKANFPDALMNVISLITVDYENIANCILCENKPNTNPIKANFKGKRSRWSGNDRIEQSPIPHNNVSNICRLTWEFIGSTMSALTF